MLLRISLIIAIVAGIATFVLSHMQVATKITNLQTDLSSTQTQLATSQDAETKARGDAKQANERADKLDRELTGTKEERDALKSRADTQQARADRNEGELNKTKQDLTDASRQLAAWKALTIPVEQVRERLALLDKANDEISGLKGENKVLLTNLKDTQNRLAKYEGGDDQPPEMKLNRDGTVLAVDTQWDFVVIDLGGNDGVVERGELLVSRDDKLVAKIRISKVESSRSVANILPEWKQAPLQVGDLVLR